MEKSSKKKILIGILIALMLMNLAALGTFVYQKYFSEPKKEQNWDKEKNPQERVKHFVRKELNLTDVQFENYCRFKDINLKNSDEIWDRLIRLRQTALVEITKENPDTILLAELSDSIGIYHHKMQKEMVRHFLTVKKSLSQEQIPKFNEMILNMEKREWRRHGNSRDGAGNQGQRNRYGKNR